MTALEKEMLKLVRAYGSSNETQEVFAASHGISKGKLHYWMKKLSKSSDSKPLTKTPSFVPLSVIAPPEQEMRRIIIRCSSGVEIEIPV